MDTAEEGIEPKYDTRWPPSVRGVLKVSVITSLSGRVSGRSSGNMFGECEQKDGTESMKGGEGGGLKESGKEGEGDEKEEGWTEVGKRGRGGGGEEEDWRIGRGEEEKDWRKVGKEGKEFK